MAKPKLLGRAPMTEPAELYACVYAKEFPTQAWLRLRPELRSQPCVVMEGEPPSQSVCSLNAKAHALGAAHGMTRVEVDTLPSATVLPRSPAEEARARAILLECAGTFSPRVEDRSGGTAFACAMDIAGTEKLFGSPENLAETLFHRILSLGITACISVSSNFETAFCMAKGISPASPIKVVPARDERAALAPLPISVLDIPGQDIAGQYAETLALWGIQTLGMLAALPETELIARMGQEGKRLRQLARGELPHLFQPVEPAFTLEEHRELDAPVELLDSLLFVMGVMLEQLILRAASRVLALASVTVTLKLEGGASHTRTVRPALPANDRQLWLKLLHLDLEAHPPPAAIVALTLVAEPGSESKVQLGLFSPQLPEPGRLDITLARIAKIVGEECVGKAVLTDTHQPEGFRMERFMVPDTKPGKAPPTRTRSAMRQLRPAESVTVMLREQRPQALRFREQQYAVEHVYGPWLSSGDWWNPGLWGFEQWDVVARGQDGGLLCCCLVRDLMQNCWQMAGLYD